MHNGWNNDSIDVNLETKGSTKGIECDYSDPLQSRPRALILKAGIHYHINF